MEKPWDSGALRAKGRHLFNGARHFFWLGDTAWLLFERLSLEETEIYIHNRAGKSFNVIQCTLSHTSPTKNHAGDYAFEGGDYTKPLPAYWAHVDAVFDIAERFGVYLAVLPAWGSMVKDNVLKDEMALPYIDFLVGRYGERPNVIWVLGGDVRGDIARAALFDAMGDRIKKLSPRSFVCFHPFGRTSSSRWFAGRDWLDMHMFQSGHRRYDQLRMNANDEIKPGEQWHGEDNWRYVRGDYALDIKPTLDAEPSYESIPHGLHDFTQPRWTAADVRRYAYWSVFEGACGHTYGSNEVMQFHTGGKTGAYGAELSWKQAIHQPGSANMGRLWALFTSFECHLAAPAPEVVANNGKKYERVSVLKGSGYYLAYSYTPRPFSLDLPQGVYKAGWFDPASGAYSYFGSVQGGQHTGFAPAGESDAVLMLTKTEESCQNG